MQQLTPTSIREKIISILKSGDILLIVPPFVNFNDIALGPQTLQALAEKNGQKTDILYLNILLASLIGVELYEKIYNAPEFWMLGERLFARSAYGLPRLGKNPECCVDEAISISGSKKHAKMFYETNHHFDLDAYLQTEQTCKLFIDEVLAVITSLNYKIIGCTTTAIGQTNCSIALLNGAKKYSPQIITIIGGSNCDGEMAKGIASLSDTVDYIFSGESETTFLNFIKEYSSERRPSQRIITGEPLKNLDNLPFPDYDIFLEQYTHFLGYAPTKKVRIWYETSRGCWWGQKAKCTFCSVHHIEFRQRSVNTALSDIKKIGDLYPDRMVFMADNIMPPSYFQELLSESSQKEEFPSLGYQLKVKPDFQYFINLKKAKIDVVLPGMETFSTNLLKLMNKGNTGSQSLLFLRNAKCVGIYADWLMLWGFPGDKISEYEKILQLIPLIRHLQPPRAFMPMELVRFSPYFENKRDIKISNLHPWAVYKMVVPQWAEVDKLAYRFIGDYPCEAHEHPEVIRRIADEVSQWRNTWKNSHLVMTHFMEEFVIYDHRDTNEKEKMHVLGPDKAKKIMTGHIYQDSGTLKWAVEEKLGVVLDSCFVPLVTASPELLSAFEKKSQQ